MNTPYLYDSDEEWIYTLDNLIVTVQTRNSANSELIFSHEFKTTEEAVTAYSHIKFGRATGKEWVEIVRMIFPLEE